MHCLQNCFGEPIQGAFIIEINSKSSLNMQTPITRVTTINVKPRRLSDESIEEINPEPPKPKPPTKIFLEQNPSTSIPMSTTAPAAGGSMAGWQLVALGLSFGVLVMAIPLTAVSSFYSAERSHQNSITSATTLASGGSGSSGIGTTAGSGTTAAAVTNPTISTTVAPGTTTIVGTTASTAATTVPTTATVGTTSSAGGTVTTATAVTPLSWVSGVAIDSAPAPKPSLNSTFVLCYNATWNAVYAVVSGNSSYMSNNSDGLANPSGLFISGSNLIYVSDTYNYRIQRFNPGNPFGTTVAQTSPFQPIALYVDQLGTIYSCEQATGITSYGRLQKYSSGNIYGVTLVGGVGNCGIAVTQICGCKGVYVSRQGLIYIADTPNHRVLAYNTTAGSMSLIAGSNGVNGYLANQLYSPTSLYVDDSGNLFVLDTGNGRIQKFSPGSTNGVTVYYENSYFGYMYNYYYYYYYMPYSNSLASTSITSDGRGSIYFGGGDLRRVTPINANVSSGIDPYTGSLVTFSGFTGLSFDSSGSCYGLYSSTIIKFTLTSNSC